MSTEQSDREQFYACEACALVYVFPPADNHYVCHMCTRAQAGDDTYPPTPRLRPLETLSLQITDAMIERGLREMYGDAYIDSLDPDWMIEKTYEMRKILTAALTEERP